MNEQSQNELDTGECLFKVAKRKNRIKIVTKWVVGSHFVLIKL